jgi:hypothetical protein
MKNLKKVIIAVVFILNCFPYLQAQSNIHINSGMPNRISMNVTVGKQTMKVAIIDGGCIISFPPRKAYRVSSANQTMTEISESEFQQRLSNAVPGGSIVSAAVSSVSTMAGGSGGGAAAASYARTGKAVWNIRDTENQYQLPENLPDGEYELSFKVVEKATSGLKDTLKTQVRLGFTIENGILKTKHDTVKNSINNVR